MHSHINKAGSLYVKMTECVVRPYEICFNTSYLDKQQSLQIL